MARVAPHMQLANSAPSARNVLVPITLLLASFALPPRPPAATLQDGTTEEAQSPEATPDDGCTLDLTLPGKMADIVSNALNRGLDQDSKEVRLFLEDAQDNYPDGQAVLKAAAAHFRIDEAVLAREVERYRHCNCTHPGGERAHLAPAGAPFELTKFASDVTLHVVLHEIGHALVREFDLPVLGNEETLADAFATHYLTTYLPERAVDVLSARTRSLMIEADEVPRDEWAIGGEHNNDARRAFQIAALAYAADPEKYRPVALGIGMSQRDMRGAADYGTEIHRSWRRTLAPLWMPNGTTSRETGIVYDAGGGFIRSSDEISGVLSEVLSRFDWHSQVKISFVHGEGGAGWSRSKRTVTVHSEYVERFVRQGRLVEAAAKER